MKILVDLLLSTLLRWLQFKDPQEMLIAVNMFSENVTNCIIQLTSKLITNGLHYVMSNDGIGHARNDLDEL